MFVGSVPLVLVLWFGVAGGWLAPARAAPAGRRAGRGAAFALGRYTPSVRLEFEWVPGVNLFRRPVDGNFVVMAALALVAGLLLADYVRDGTPRVAPWRIAAVGLGALGVIGWAVVFSERTHHGWASLGEVLKVAPLALVVIVVLALARSPHAGRWPRPARDGGDG